MLSGVAGSVVPSIKLNRGSKKLYGGSSRPAMESEPFTLESFMAVCECKVACSESIDPIELTDPLLPEFSTFPIWLDSQSNEIVAFTPRRGWR
jgi:hypothetical protein